MNRQQKVEFILQGINKEKTFIAMSLINRVGVFLPLTEQQKEEEAEIEKMKAMLNVQSDAVLDEIINRINKI